ncbi:MAG: N-6 DNA methylase [Terriglobia bacterium]
MRGLDVLSTAGRALFFRFLMDRGIVTESELADICPGAGGLRDCFSDAEKAAATSCWLDETFNGDLLPLISSLSMEANGKERLRAYQHFYRGAGAETQQRLFGHLQAILRGWEQVSDSQFQMSFEVDWDDFNFAHIPIGVLSQVYETFSRQWDEEHSDVTSVYYTPRHIAKLLVDEAFAGLENAAEAVILDPACGAGVFLVLAFRQLVRKYWEKNGSRPDTRAIQRILYKQLRGFEVSESALRLSALALYISAIEVNGTQRPPRSLKFPRPLRNEVLFNFGQHEKDKKPGFVLGSLGPNVPASFNGSFDIVVTNPPWTRLRSKAEDTKEKAEDKKRIGEMNEAFTALTRSALTARGLESIAKRYDNPDNNPDLPFLWRATEWAKPNGVIAMALPGRIILRQDGMGKRARDAMMRGLAVTGILNGSDLEKTPVWPNMDLPFLLLFARNSVPEPDHHFHFATPIRENRLTSRGRFRLDYQAAETIAAEAVVEKPWLLKALAVGTQLDFEVVEKIQQKAPTKLGEFWRPPRLDSGVGYKIAPGLKQGSANDLLDLLDFEKPPAGFHIDLESLKKWRERNHRKEVHSTGNISLYRAPLLIIPQAPGEGRENPKSFRSPKTGICFSQSYYGYSSSEHPEGELLNSMLYLLTHSLLFQHFCLVHSSRIGASYRTFIKEDLDAFPFLDPTQLTAANKRRIVGLAEALEMRATKPWQEIDDFIFGLYGLDEDDARVVRDTVAFCGPYRSVREPAEQPAEPGDMDVFRAYLEDMLQPLFQVATQRCIVTVLSSVLGTGEWIPSWRFVSITLAGDKLPDVSKSLNKLMGEANKTGASRIVLRVPNGGLVIGILNQRRFWTRSRARLCSLHIEQHHLDAFPIPAP